MEDSIVELLGFIPIQFVDQVINLVNQTLYKVLPKLEKTLQQEIGNVESEKAMQQIETLVERSIDFKFDRFEIYVLNNILCFPKNKQFLAPIYQVNTRITRI
jgi:chemotaxis protein CheY-P-specific phosphatase CheC